MWAPIAVQIYIWALQFSGLPPRVFGERHALPRPRCIDGRNSAGAAAARNLN